MKRILVILFLISVAVMYVWLRHGVKVDVTPIQGNMEFTNEYQPDATVCIPAAYTDGEGNIVGQYRIKSKSHGGKYFKERVSLHPSKGLVINSEWTSANGFQ